MAIIELKKPEAITCTSLRQQIATMSQVYEINDTQQDQLAQFLGHNIRVHQKFYRLSLDIMQKAKVAKLLIAVNDGQSLPDANLEDLHIDADGKAFIDVLLWIKFSTGLSFICEIWCYTKKLFFTEVYTFPYTWYMQNYIGFSNCSIKLHSEMSSFICIYPR